MSLVLILSKKEEFLALSTFYLHQNPLRKLSDFNTNPSTFPFNTGAERLLLAWPYLRCTALVQCAGHVEKTAMIYEPLVLLLCLFFFAVVTVIKKGMVEL